MTATTLNDLRLWKIFGGCNAFGGIWNVPTWSRHGGALLGNVPLLCSGREIYPKPRVVSSPKPGFFATVSTNAHGLYARRSDGDTNKSIFFRCVFNWYRSMRLIDLMAVGGSGGHFSPEYFDYLRIPRFPDDVRAQVVELYHNPSPPPADKVTLKTFVDWHRRWNAALGIWELDREMKALQRTLAGVQERIIEGKRVAVPL